MYTGKWRQNNPILPLLPPCQETVLEVSEPSDRNNRIAGRIELLNIHLDAAVTG